MKKSVVIIGIFISLVSTLIGMYIFLLSGRMSSGSYILYANISNINGILEGSTIKTLGVKIGRIKNLSIINNKIRVKLEISKDYKIYSDDVLKKTSQGILGAGFLEIIPKKTGYILKNGDTIVNIEDSKSFDSIASSADNITQDVEKITAQLSKYIAESDVLKQISLITKQLSLTLSSVQKLTEELNNTVEINAQAITQTTHAITLITNEIGKFLVNDKSDSSQEMSDTLLAIKNALSNIETLTAKLSGGEGTVGKLLTDDELYNNLNTASKNITSLTNRAAGLNTAFDYKFEGLASASSGFLVKNHVNIRITPPDSTRYYQVGVTQGGSKSAAENLNFKLNLIFGQNLFNDYVTIKGGILENTGGFGIDVHPFKQWEIGGEVFNFGVGTGANVRTYTYIYPFFNPKDKYNPLKWLYFGGGVNDVLSYQRSYFFGIGLRFQDGFIQDTVRMVPVAASITSLQ